MAIDILMPALSPTMEEGKLAKWLKKEGDKVKPGDILAEIETDKATMEVEAIDEGVLAKILVSDGTDNVAVNTPIAILAGEGDGFMIAQARLGPGRIHHCMRAIGMAERALALMVERAKSRVAFGRPLAEQGTVREQIALSRIEIDQARLYVYRTAWLIDRHGAKGARTEIAGIKVAAPAMALRVIDRAIEVFGAAGVSDDTPLAYFYAWARVLRIVDGPDAVHRRSIAREELKRERPYVG